MVVLFFVRINILLMVLIARFVIFIYSLISKLPLRWLYVFADIFAWFMYHVRMFPVQKIVRRRIAQAFPHESMTWKRKVERDFYRKASDFGAEFIKLISWNKEEISSRLHCTNIQLLKNLLEQHRYVVCFGGHFVNYELFTVLPMHLGDYGMCNYYDDSIRSIYPELDQWIQNLRSRCGSINIPISSPLRAILKLNQEITSDDSQLKGFVLGSLLDTRKVGPNQQKASIMGEEFPLHYGTEKIGLRLGAAFVYAHMSCPERGQYEVTLKHIHPDEKGSYMKSYIEELEYNIQQQPSLWLMWGAS